jgi:nucleolar protein 16
MGRELQKRKNRSSVSKVKHKPKSKKRLLTHPIIAANWDKTQTLAQNYKRLGLTARLNKNTGGIEKKVSDILPVESNDRYSLRDTLNITSSSKRGQKIDLSEAKIERDPETGKILRVIDEKLPKANPLNDPLNELESDSEDDTGIFSLRNQHDAVVKKPSSAHSTAVTDTVKQLEAEASRPVTKYKRKQPDGEREFIEDLVRKYGDDVGKMARDTKINYMQRSEGDLKKRIKRWRENGGSIE